MRDLTDSYVDQYRDRSPEVIHHFGWVGDAGCGAFMVPSPIDGQLMRVIASSAEGWDHVSVSRRTRCPNYPEMQRIYQMFFKPDETAMQLHVPSTDHINCHPHCLHLWRPHDSEIPRPPAIMVGPPEAA